MFLALVLFVGIPVLGTGAWTGILASSILELDFKESIGACFCGVLLKGEEIPLAARIVALADVFDALSHQRVYKEAWSLDDTFNEIEKERGRQFDPEVVDAFIQIKDRIVAINNAM
jgi:hypothetical protein